MGKNILFLISRFSKNTDANGICIKNISDELIKMGHSVWVIEASECNYDNIIYDGIKFYGIKETAFTKLSRFFSKKTSWYSKIVFEFISFVRHLIVIFLYPNVSPCRAVKVRNKALAIINQCKIDIIVGVLYPYESVYSIMSIKKMMKDDIYAISYHLDLLSSPNDSNKYVKKYKQWKSKSWLNKEYSIVDRMILPESVSQHLYDNKIRYVDFPLYVNKQLVEYDYQFPDNVINITYIGSLDKNNRNPEMIIRMINDYNKLNKKAIVLHIWGILADATVTNLIKDSDCVQYHSYLENKYIDYLLKYSDFLLNISNMITYNMIPSKIFQLFKSKKPIINYVQHQDDCTLSYFQKYDNVLNINSFDDDYIIQLEKLNGFILNNINVVSLTTEETFIRSTPSYICKQLLE